MKKSNFWNIIMAIIVLLTFPAILVGFLLASNNIISPGIPIVGFGLLLIIIPIFGKDVDNSHRNQITGKIISIMTGLSILSLGVSIISKSINLFIYAFINMFGISGLFLVIYLIYRYFFNKKYCNKKVIGICTSNVEDHNYSHIGSNYYSTSRPVFTIFKENGKKKQLIYDVSSLKTFIIGRKYELMVNPNNYDEFYIVGLGFFEEHLIEIIIAGIFILSTIVEDCVLLMYLK